MKNKGMFMPLFLRIKGRKRYGNNSKKREGDI